MTTRTMEDTLNLGNLPDTLAAIDWSMGDGFSGRTDDPEVLNQAARYLCRHGYLLKEGIEIASNLYAFNFVSADSPISARSPESVVAMTLLYYASKSDQHPPYAVWINGFVEFVCLNGPAKPAASEKAGEYGYTGQNTDKIKVTPWLVVQ